MTGSDTLTRVWSRLFAVAVGAICCGAVFWFALVHTVHRGTISVPDLRGMDEQTCRQTVHDLGLELDVATPGTFSTEVARDLVASQQPPPGFHLKTGGSVVVRLSMGDRTITVPDVAGTAVQTAVRELEMAGLTPGQRSNCEGQAAGEVVMATDPAGGSKVAPETTVRLLVNRVPRKPLWITPNLLQRPLPEARRFVRANGLRIGQVHEVDYLGQTPGTVVRQYPRSGAPLSRSDIITLWVSR